VPKPVSRGRIWAVRKNKKEKGYAAWMVWKKEGLLEGFLEG